MDENKTTEAPFSVTFDVLTPGGLPALVTIRPGSIENGLRVVQDFQDNLLASGFQPNIRRYQKQEAPKEYVPGRACPQCGAKLIYKTKRDGGKFIICENRKWNPATKETSGCSYIDWGNTPVAFSAPATNQQFLDDPDLATAQGVTQAQKALIINKWPELWREGMSFEDAVKIIGTYQK